MRVEGYELIFARSDNKHNSKAVLKANRHSSLFIRAYLIKKQQFNNLLLIRSGTSHGSVVIAVDRLRSNSRRLLRVEHPQPVVLNKESLEGAVVKLGEYDRIPMYAAAMPPLASYQIASPDLKQLKSILIGLVEGFPLYSQDFLIYYLYTKEGVKSCYTAREVSRIALKQSEKPTPGAERLSSGLCDSEESLTDKENKMPNTKENPVARLKKQAKMKPKFGRHKAKETLQSKNASIPKTSNTVMAIDRMKTNLLRQIECKKANTQHGKGGELSKNGHMLLELSNIQDLSDLDKESVADGLGQRNSCGIKERLKQDVAGHDLYCPEDIHDVFKFNSFAS